MPDEPVRGVKISTFPSAQTIRPSDLVTGLQNRQNTNFSFGTILTWFRQTIEDFYIAISEKGRANGVASLDSTGKVTNTQIPFSASDPLMDGTASSGSANTVARSDHRHPSDTSKISASEKGAASGVASLGSDGKVPSAQLPTIPSASSATPQNLGTAAAGSSADYSRADHVHNKPTAADINAQPTITASGILKGDGQGGVSAATPGTDYGTYSKPSGGIPSSDMASGVQTSLGKADTAYQKPSGGIPASDIASGVIPTVPSPSSTNPKEDGTVSPGSSSDYARGDHVHPHDSIKANHAEFAYLESGSTASRAYGIGEYFTQKTSGRLLRVTVPISAGGTFTPGTNCEYTTVGSELQDKPKNMVFTLTAGKTLTITKTAGALYSYLISGAGPAAFGSLWWVMGYSNTGTQTKLVTLSTSNSLVITNAAASITIQNTHSSNGARVTVLVLGYEGTLPTYTVS